MSNEREKLHKFARQSVFPSLLNMFQKMSRASFLSLRFSCPFVCASHVCLPETEPWQMDGY